MAEVFQIVITNHSEKDELSLNNVLEQAGIKAEIVKNDYYKQKIAALEHQIAIHKQHLNENQELIVILQNIIQQQQQEIKIFEQLKTKLLRILSHELRTPLNLILGYSQLMLRQHYGRLNRRQLTIVEKVLLGGRNLLKSLDKMLDLSNLEADCLPLQIEQFNLIYLVEDIIKELVTQAEKKHLKLQVDCDLQNPLIVSDLVKLRQILIDLIENGIKFTEQGSVQITVTETTREQIIIQVKDTGIGIPVELIDQIFDKFWQADQSLQRQHQGLGLGLALVKNLVTIIQGRITVESQLGQGSTFTISLPRQLTINHHQSIDER